MSDKDDGDKMERWWEERRLPEKIGLGILFALGGIGFIFFFGWIVMLLWNWLMPELFGLKTVTYWQAWGLLVLSSILFGKLGGSSSNCKSDRKRKNELKRKLREGSETDFIIDEPSIKQNEHP